MSSYPPPPRRLTRSTSDRLIGGVCGGLASYLNMDANLVRILTVLISLFTGVPVILYVIALFVVPEDTSASSAPPPVTGAGYSGSFSGGQPAPPPPAYAPYPGTPAQSATRPAAQDPVWGSEGPPWEQPTSPEPAAPSEPEAPVVPPPTGVRPDDQPPPRA